MTRADRPGGRPTRSGEPADIVFVGFLLGHGGDALQMLLLAQGVRDRGASVRLVVPAVDESITFGARCAALGLPCERTPLIASDLKGPRQRLRSLITLLRARREPIVHFHTGDACLPRLLLLAMYLVRARPAFVTVQSPYESFAPDSVRARIWAAAVRQRFLAVVSPSDHGRAFQLRCGVPERLAVTVHNAIDIAAMAAGDGAGPRAELGVGPDDPIVLFCSRIDTQKRPLDAVRSFAALADEFPDAVLVVVGRGSLEAEMAAEASRLGVAERVRLVGYQTNVPDWLAAATLWFLPTERENYCVAVLEAMAAGCAVVSSSCPGNDEVLVDGVNARTFAVGDTEGAAACLRDLLGDPAARARLGAAAREVAAAHGAHQMVDEYCAVYRRAEHPPSWAGR